MLLQKVAMVRGGGPSKPAAAPVLPFDPDGTGQSSKIYDQLARSGHAGQALYDLEAAPEAPELDFCAWIEGLGWFDLEVKGGR